MKTWSAINGHMLIKENVGSIEQRTTLIHEIMKLYVNRDTKILTRTNPGCWRTFAEVPTMNWLKDELMSVIDETINYFRGIDLAFNQNFKIDKPTITHWVNVNKTGGGNVLHNHQLHEFAAVYYLQAKDTGSLIFHNPGNLLRDCAEQAPGTTTMHYTPNDGDLIIWPGWIPHEVEENPASHERINFAFNINLTSRQLVNNTT